MPQIIKTIQVRLKNNHFNPIVHVAYLHLSHFQGAGEMPIVPGETKTILVPIYSLGAIDLIPKNSIQMKVTYGVTHNKIIVINFPEEANIIAIDWEQSVKTYDAIVIE